MAKQIIRTTCEMCGVVNNNCGIDVHVKDGKIVKVEGTKGHPINDGSLCPKGLAAIQSQYDPNRLKYPMRRVGKRGEGKWERISWDTALDTIAQKFKEIIDTDGAQAISWLKGAGPSWEEHWEFAQRFMHFLGSPNMVAHGYLCHLARMIGHMATYGSLPAADYDNTSCMLLWGYNPANTQTSNHMRRIMAAKQRGAKLIVVDPRFSKTAAKADIWVQPRPGSDGALAPGMLNVIITEELYDKAFVDKWTYGFDKLAEMVKDYPPEKVESITWVPADVIREVARVYATTKPAVLYEQNGVDMQPNVAQTARAISCLRAITGNLDIPGGNIFFPGLSPAFKKTADIGMSRKPAKEMQQAFKKSVGKHPLYYAMHYLTVPEIVDAILTDKPYPIKAAIIYGMNPAVVIEDTDKVVRALKKVPFLVVFDRVKTATAEFADILLPAANFFEKTMTNTYLWGCRPGVDSEYFSMRRKVLEPMGESKSDFDFISELARKMGYVAEFPWKTVEEAIDYELAPIGMSYKQLAEYPDVVYTRRYEPSEVYRKYEKALARMSTKKVELYSTSFERMGYDPLPRYQEVGESPVSRPDLAREYPLIMSCFKPGLYTQSQHLALPWLKEIMPEPWLEMNPLKARELGIKDGDTVVVKSPRGSLDIKCRLTNAVDPRVVMATFGWGNSSAGPDRTINVLAPGDIYCPITNGNSSRCFLISVTKNVRSEASEP